MLGQRRKPLLLSLYGKKRERFLPTDLWTNIVLLAGLDETCF